MKKQKIMLLLEITLFIMIVGTIASYAAGSNPPSDGVRYINNGQATVEGALNDLYEKIGGSSSSSCLPSRTASTETLSSGSSKTYYSGSYANGWTVSCANKTCPQDVYKKYTLSRTEVKLDTTKTSSTCQQTFKSGNWKRFTKAKDCRAYFTVPLSITPSEVVAIDIEMSGNEGSWSFKSPGGTLIKNIHFRLGDGERFTTTDSITNYSLGFNNASVSGNELVLMFDTFTGGSGSTNYSYQTSSDKFYVEGTILYK